MCFSHLIPFVWKSQLSEKFHRKNRGMQAEHSQVIAPEFPDEEDSSNGNANMELDTEVEMPWKDGFELGEGIDAITGKTKRNPFQDITWSPSEWQDEVFKSASKFVHQLHELHQDTHASAGATVNTNSPVTGGAHFDYLLSKERSSASFMVKHELTGKYGFDRPPQSIFKLKPEAQQYLNDPAQFRRRYGDYFIYSYKRGYSFQALVVCSADKAKTTQSTEAKAEAYVTGLFSTDAQAALKNTDASDLTVESTFVMQQGCQLKSLADLAGGSNSDVSASNVSLKAAVQMARDIQTNKQPCMRERVLLKHYSFLYDQIPEEVPVTKNAFFAVRDLGNIVNWLELHVAHPSVPTTHRQKMTALIKRFWDHQPSLSGDKETRKSISEELKLALTTTAFIINTSERIRSGEQNQPEDEIKTNDPNPNWAYGITPQVKDCDEKYQPVEGEENISQCFLLARVETNGPVKLHFMSNPSSRVSKEKKPSEFSFAGRAEIIGWSLSCTSEDGEEVSFKVKDGGIREKRLSITAKAPIGREWHCRITFRETPRRI